MHLAQPTISLADAQANYLTSLTSREQRSAGGPIEQGFGPKQFTLPSAPSDGFAQRAFPLPGNPFSLTTGVGVPAGDDPFLQVINNLISGLGALINQFAAGTGTQGADGQHVAQGSFSSTGDPHLSERASVVDSAGNTSQVDRHFDSMNGHENLLSSQDFAGGYRLSTTVTKPDAAGVTLNAGATVHLNSDLDQVTLRKDGSVAITSDGNGVELQAGQTVTLGGGETVTRNADGSLTVLAQNSSGGSITTTMSAKGGGVDVTAVVTAATVGGEITDAIAQPAAADPATQRLLLG